MFIFREIVRKRGKKWTHTREISLSFREFRRVKPNYLKEIRKCKRLELCVMQDSSSRNELIDTECIVLPNVIKDCEYFAIWSIIWFGFVDIRTDRAEKKKKQLNAPLLCASCHYCCSLGHVSFLLCQHTIQLFFLHVSSFAIRLSAYTGIGLLLRRANVELCRFFIFFFSAMNVKCILWVFNQSTYNTP